MHASTNSDRRAPSQARMPVTMSVELGHDGWDETYEADAVNLSSAGIGVRAPMLPDVGQRLRCRFRMPELDGPCEAEGEVVWASDAGDAGEFGIRFDGLEPHVSEVLARWVSSLEGGERPRTEPGIRRPSVKVQLDGVASPIEAEVAVSDARRVRVEQPLPFLLLGTKATVSQGEGSGLRRVLRSVELKIDGAVPRLVLELDSTLSEADESPDGAPEAPSTVADQPLEEILAKAAPAMRSDEEILREVEQEVASEAPPSVDDLPAPPVARAIAPKKTRAESERAARKREDDSPRAIKLEERDPLAELGVDASEDDAEDEGPSLTARLREVGERAGPTFGRLVTALKTGWASFVAAAGPRGKALGAWLGRLMASIKEQMTSRWPAIRERLMALRPGGAPKRRTTTAPPEAETGRAARKKGVEPAPEIAKERPRLPLRYVLAGGVVLAATMMLVRAFSGSTEEPAPVAHAPTLAIEETSEPAVTEPVVEVVSAPAELTPPAPEAPVTEPAATLPGTLGAHSTEVGRLEAPTFPRVGEASESPETATAAPTEEPLPAPTGRMAFGAADVPHGRSTTLTMTLPITSVEGEATDTGFTVNLPGVNSLSRAAPIAAANPSVERAAILNSGDHAVLTVRFVPGRTPAYRVEARGSDLIVTIGR